MEFRESPSTFYAYINDDLKLKPFRNLMMLVSLVLFLFFSLSCAQTCPELIFQSMAAGAIQAQGCQTPTDASGNKTLTCSDGPGSTQSLLSFTYDDGSGAGAQNGVS